MLDVVDGPPVVVGEGGGEPRVENEIRPTGRTDHSCMAAREPSATDPFPGPFEVWSGIESTQNSSRREVCKFMSREHDQGRSWACL
jgi:hypothetical protein